MNITQKLYSKRHLNGVLAFILFFYILCTSFLLHKILFSRMSTSGLSCIQSSFSKMKLVKTLVRTELKRTNLENRLCTSTETPKERFDDTVFQHLLDELNHCNSDVRIDLQLLVPVFLCLLFSIFGCNFIIKNDLFHNFFCLIYFPREFAIF